MENMQMPELSHEEIAARKEEMLNFYKDQIEFLKVQIEFETLTADIEDARLRRLVAMVRQAQIQSPSEPESEGSANGEKPKRTLRKEE
jgi:hypothetical protein